MSILLPVFIGLGLALGDVLMKKWMLTAYTLTGTGLLYVVSALLVYCISLIGYATLLKTTNLNVATIITVSVNVVIVMFIGTLFFKESFNIYHIVGAGFCLLGITFIILK